MLHEASYTVEKISDTLNLGGICHTIRKHKLAITQGTNTHSPNLYIVKFNASFPLEENLEIFRNKSAFTALNNKKNQKYSAHISKQEFNEYQRLLRIPNRRHALQYNTCRADRVYLANELHEVHDIECVYL